MSGVQAKLLSTENRTSSDWISTPMHVTSCSTGIPTVKERDTRPREVRGLFWGQSPWECIITTKIYISNNKKTPFSQVGCGYFYLHYRSKCWLRFSENENTEIKKLNPCESMSFISYRQKDSVWLLFLYF
jgi:hypothetical protein